MPVDRSLGYPTSWRQLTASWLRRLVDLVESSRIIAGPGIISGESQGGQQVAVTDAVRFQIRTAEVITQAPVATKASGVLTPKSGTMKLHVPDSLDGSTTPPTVRLRTELRGGTDQPPPLRFWNRYTSGPSPTAGKTVFVVWTAQGWTMITGDC